MNEFGGKVWKKTLKIHECGIKGGNPLPNRSVVAGEVSGQVLESGNPATW